MAVGRHGQQINVGDEVVHWRRDRERSGPVLAEKLGTNGDWYVHVQWPTRKTWINAKHLERVRR